jgi:hypothetical protein
LSHISKEEDKTEALFSFILCRFGIVSIFSITSTANQLAATYRALLYIAVCMMILTPLCSTVVTAFIPPVSAFVTIPDTLIILAFTIDSWPGATISFQHLALA